MKVTPLIENNDSVEILTENEGRDLYLKGICIQADVVNRNNRLYPPQIVTESVKRYLDKHQKKNLVGELNHPTQKLESINPDRISHRFTHIQLDGNNVIGKAKILNTTTGTQVRNLIEGGVELGMSSRGFGRTKNKNGVEVVESLTLVTLADIVIDPSAPDAWQQAVYENKEWVYENGVLVEQDVTPIMDKVKETLYSKTGDERDQIIQELFDIYIAETGFVPIKEDLVQSKKPITFGDILRG